MKNTQEGKSGRGLRLGKLPDIWGFPLIFLQRLHCSLSVSGVSCFCFASVKCKPVSIKQMGSHILGGRLTKMCEECPLHLKYVRALPGEI